MTDCQIVPVATYNVRATVNGMAFSSPLTIGTILKPQLYWGDCVGSFDAEEEEFLPPSGFISVTDIQAFLFANGGLVGAPHTTWVDLQAGEDPVVPQQILNVGDLQWIQFAFWGKVYGQVPGHYDPGDCP